MNIAAWTKNYQQAVNAAFKGRVLFIGLQGSFARGEATAHSDIDMVLILDELNLDDLQLYQQTVAGLAQRDRLCGFVAGQDEVRAWSRHDLFQLYFDTMPLQGSWDELMIPRMTSADGEQAALAGACQIYHACIHNFLHTNRVEILQSLYKTAFFTMQAAHFCKTGVYVNTKSRMSEAVDAQERPMMEVIMNPALIDPSSITAYSRMLLEWSSRLIRLYGNRGTVQDD